MSFDPWAQMPDPEPNWPPGDPRWRHYRAGWLAGYRAGRDEAREMADPVFVDALLTARFGQLLAALREREHG